MDSDNTDDELVFPDDSASGAGDEGEERSTPGTTTETTTSTPSAQFTFTLLPVDATTTTSVHVDIHPSNTEPTQANRVKRIYDVTGMGRTFPTSWDGTNDNGGRVPNGDYQVIGTATYFASSGSSRSSHSYTSSAAHTVTVSGGSITVKILSSTEHSPGSETSLAIDTEGVPGRGPDPVTGEDPTTATIYYEISGARPEDLPRREVTFEVDNDSDPSNTPLLTVVLDNNITGVKKFVWNGKIAKQPRGFHYGLLYAHVRLKINIDDDADWEHEYYNQYAHEITVFSYPVAEAGLDKVVAIDPTTNSVIVKFNGQFSHDPDDVGIITPNYAAIDAWNWSFAGTDLTQDPNSGSGTVMKPSTIYRTAGIRTATLIVTDNDPSPQNDDDDVEVAVIDVQINLPVPNAKRVLPTMEVQGTPLPAEISSASTISWEIIIGAEPHTTSTQGLAKDTLVVHPFPLLNSNFGLNKVVATLNYKTGSVTREQPVRLFFDKDGVLLDSDWPNWYRFWSQTPANIGPHVYDPTLVHFGEYKFALGEPHFYIGRAAGGSIDDFGTTCVHEDQHRKDWKKWWGDPHGYYVQAEDMDLDWVPDSEEPGLGFVVGMVDSDDDDIDDIEESAEMAELTWTVQSTTPGSGTKRAQAYEQDWSERGKQW